MYATEHEHIVGCSITAAAADHHTAIRPMSPGDDLQFLHTSHCGLQSLQCCATQGSLLTTLHSVAAVGARYDDLLHAAVTFTDTLAVQQAAAAVQTFLQHNITFQRPPAPADSTTVPISRGLKQYDTTTNINIYAADGAVDAASAAAAGPDRPAGSQPDSQARLSLLSGIPYGLKDLFAVPGYPTSWGMTALKNRTINTVR